MMPATFAVTVIDSKARTVPTASRVSTMRPVFTVSTSTTGAPPDPPAPRPPGAPAPAAAAQAGE